MTYMKDWPLVPVDPACVPEGHEAVRVSYVNAGETMAGNAGRAFVWPACTEDDLVPRLIIRPIPKPIRLPTTIVPPGWWVARDGNDDVWIYIARPQKQACNWGGTDEMKSDYYMLPPHIATQLPAEYLALPWDKSLMQQTEGM